MLFKLCSLYSPQPNSATADPTTDNGEPRVKQFDYIAEENFLLVALLASDDSIDVYYKTGSSVKVCRRSISEFYDEASTAVLVTLLPDACAVAVVFANGSVLTIPIKYFLAVSWSSDSKFAQTITFHSATCAETAECSPPVGTACFTSKVSTRVILVFTTREGYIVIWDLTAESVNACIHGPDNVRKLEINQKDEETFLVLLCDDGEQWSIPIESEGRTIRNTLAHVIPSQLQPVSPAAIFNDGKRQIYYDSKKNELYLRQISPLAFASLPVRKFNPKCLPRLVNYNQDLLTVVDESDDVFVTPHFTSNVPVDDVYYPVLVDQPQRVLGFLPSVHSSTSQLYEPVVVTEFGIANMKALKSLEQFAVECTINSGFNSTVCRNIATRLSRDAVSLCHDVVRTALCNAPTPTELTLIISMALDLQMDTNHLIAIFNEFDRSDALLPVLLRTCNKHPDDTIYSNALLEAYCCRFQKMPKEDTPNAETDLRTALLKYNYDASSLANLLKHKLWSSAVVLLSKDVSKYTLPVATFLLEVPSWHSLGPTNVVRFLSLIEWSLLEGRAQSLITRMVTYMPSLTSRSQLLVFSRIAELFVNACPGVAQPMFLVANTRLLNSSFSNGFLPISRCCVGSVGSNHCVVIGADDSSLIFWGAFAAGPLRMPDRSPTVNRLLTNSQQKTTKVLPPTQLKLNPPSDEFGSVRKIRSVDCGTEHCLVLCDDGTVYSWGTNRYGQCGQGHKTPVLEPKIVDGPWSGVACSVVAGNYHSAILSKTGELWMCGWGFYGQLANERFDNQFVFTKIHEFSDSQIIAVSCGYAHTLTLTKDGRIYAFGGGAYGQLGMDIAAEKAVLDSTSTSAGGFPAERKRCKPQLVPLEDKITAMSSRFFHAIAVSESNKVYSWGSSPQALKLKMYAAKQLREKAARDNKTADGESPSQPLRSISKSHFDVGRGHMEVSEVPVKTGGANIVGVSTGLCHSGFITEDGHLFMWGKNLDMQLGFGRKKEFLEPTRVPEPSHVKWLEVHCGLNSTLGVTTNGCVYVCGRNDLTKLGLPNSKESKPNKITLNSPRGVRVLCLPQDSCLVGTPTVLGGVHSSVASGWLPCLDKQELLNRFANTDQLTLNAVSRHFTKHPTVSDVVISVHLLAGDLINAVETLAHYMQEQPLSGVSSTCSAATSRSTSSAADSPSEINSNFVAEQRKASLFTPVKATEALELKVFDELLDRAWNLLRIHPLREVQLKTLLYLLYHRFPVYNRLAADLRMCRLIEPYLELKKEQRRLTQLTLKERFGALQNCRIRDQGVLKKQLIGVDRYRYYSACGHYEQTGIQGGVSRAELAAARNRLRKCSRCLQRR
uniref:Rod_C domain-containing protein n=1 Tax=Steinernema glaseri TaxID=37863 RepID=A0A1I7YE09_9BILA